jgi:hypothetical protein
LLWCIWKKIKRFGNPLNNLDLLASRISSGKSKANFPSLPHLKSTSLLRNLDIGLVISENLGMNLWMKLIFPKND